MYFFWVVKTKKTDDEWRKIRNEINPFQAKATEKFTFLVGRKKNPCWNEGRKQTFLVLVFAECRTHKSHQYKKQLLLLRKHPPTALRSLSISFSFHPSCLCLAKVQLFVSYIFEAKGVLQKLAGKVESRSNFYALTGNNLRIGERKPASHF